MNKNINKKSTFENKNIAVLGLGVTGLSSVFYCVKKGNIPTIFDTRMTPPGLDKKPLNVPIFCGPLDSSKLMKFELIVASPGIALSTPELLDASNAGVEIIGDIELFARELKTAKFKDAKLVTITGANGKSTVTDLLGAMAVNSDMTVGVGGNFGVPALNLLDPKTQLYILELSSFQLETTSSLNADIATVLNITEDHMDRYDSFKDYVLAKQKIYTQCKLALVNRDDPLTISNNKKIDQISFGFDKSEYGIITDEDGEVFLAIDQKAIFNVKDLKLSGKHNWSNALAALALGTNVGLPLSKMLDTLKTYKGLEHRCEFVSQIDGVRWINDSKATNIGATIAALHGLSSTISGKVHVILGGAGKGADFSELADVLDEIKGSIVCFGADGKTIAMQNSRSKIVDDLEEAITFLSETSKSGDIVILTPACASLDMYKNFMARGDHFKSLVHSLEKSKDLAVNSKALIK